MQVNESDKCENVWQGMAERVEWCKKCVSHWFHKCHRDRQCKRQKNKWTTVRERSSNSADVDALKIFFLSVRSLSQHFLVVFIQFLQKPTKKWQYYLRRHTPKDIDLNCKDRCAHCLLAGTTARWGTFFSSLVVQILLFHHFACLLFYTLFHLSQNSQSQ